VDSVHVRDRELSVPVEPITVDERVDNAISRYYHGVELAIEDLRAAGWDTAVDYFQPTWNLPARSAALDRFFAHAVLSGGSAGAYRGHPLWLLDMTGNPRTRTTKTFGSLIIVARALHHTATTGEPIMLITPSAANKAVALRDAVLRAYEAGLAGPETLRATVVVPTSSLPKLWDSPLLADPHLARTNPIGVYDGAEREDVKRIATAAVREAAEDIRRSTGFRVWYTLDPRNYMVADVVRAFYEEDELPPAGADRWHAHAVSSAYGFLGHDHGRNILAKQGTPATGRAHYLLVQHLETPDLVVGFQTDGYRLPEYAPDQATGLYRQVGADDPHFPAVCYSPDERLERTFYTRRPPTTPRVRELIGRSGGDGIVVSLHECLQRYQEVRALLAAAGMTRLPEDPRRLHEWAMVMAVVGTLTAIDRGLLPAGQEVLLHGSGAYSEGEFENPDRSALRPVATAEDIVGLLRDAADR
jgi:hypothetical protein